MNAVTIVGTVGAVCSTVSFAPQAVKIIRTRETQDISLGMYVFTVTGFMAWTAYGFLLRQWPLILANGICLLLSAFILFMKIVPRRTKEKVADSLGATKDNSDTA